MIEVVEMFRTKNIKPEEQIFHNVTINVYPKRIHFNKISYWKKNLRTLLSFRLLEKKYNKKLSEISLDEITDYLAGKRVLKIKDLSDSIKRNGVRVPMIVLEDGTLLDGNRRYFACNYLLKKSKEANKPVPLVLKSIPVWIIRNKDVNPILIQKILAEANFVDDHKVEWSADVSAKVIYDQFMSLKKAKLSKGKIYEELFDIYGVEKKTVDDYVDTIKLSFEFIKFASRKEKDRYREILQDKFLYFWEFKNKAYSKRLALDEDKEMPKLKKLFFKMMANDKFNNFKQVEPMIRSIRDGDTWKILTSSGGSKIDQIEAIYKEEKAIKSAEDKIRNFVRWLDKSDSSSFSRASYKLLGGLAEKLEKTT